MWVSYEGLDVTVGALETGHTVVYCTTVEVTWPTGQLVTVGAQDVIVYTDVAYTVDVVSLVGLAVGPAVEL